MKNFFSFCILLILISIAAPNYAQDDPQLTQFAFNSFQFNPAIAGSENAIVTTATTRNQWINLTGAPQTQLVNSHMPLYKLSSGIGLQIFNALEGQQRNTGASISYNYQKHFRKATLQFGASGGIIQKSLNGNKLVTPSGSYEGQIIDHNDPQIPVSLVNDFKPDIAAGIYFFTERFYLGLSATHLLNNYYTFETDDGITSIQNQMNGFLIVGCKLSFDESFTLKPSILVKSDFNQPIIDVNTILDYKNNIFIGGSFRSYLNKQTDAIALIGGWNISEKFGISYSYDITLSDLKLVSDGSHEIVVRYKIFIEKPRVGKEINNLRYLYY